MAMSLTVKGGVCQLEKITCPKSPFYVHVKISNRFLPYGGSDLASP